jgi:hypothetical protein
MTRLSKHNVVGTFSDMKAARDAMTALGRAGVEADRISMLGREAEEAASDPDTRLRDIEVTGDVAKKAGAAGAAGSALGALAGAAAFVIPGIGPVLGSGIWAGLLAGGAAGGVIGGMVGGVGALSLQELDLTYQHSLREGKAMVAVAADDEEAAATAGEVLEHEGAEGVDLLDSTGQKIG